MTTLDPSSGYIVLINTFTVEPENAEQLLAELSRATLTVIQHQRGFVSANLHLSTDKRHIANYAQWRSQADIDAMMNDPAIQQHMQVAAGIATAFDPIYYQLREAHTLEQSPI